MTKDEKEQMRTRLVQYDALKLLRENPEITEEAIRLAVQQMTREQVEEIIMDKLKLIREIALAYAPERQHVSMYFIGPHINLSNCCKREETDGILDCFEVVGDGKGIYSFRHGEDSLSQPAADRPKTLEEGAKDAGAKRAVEGAGPYEGDEEHAEDQT